MVKQSIALICLMAGASIAAIAASPTPREVADLAKAAKAQLTAQLRDPTSVQYRGLYVARADSGELVVCGEYNARNGYGGYSGFEAFIASRDKLLFTGGILYGQLCGDKVAPIR